MDTASVLRILAHELRSPAGVALGYVRMALEGRLPNPADHRRALEQTQRAIERMSALGREASDVASWLEREPTSGWRTARVRALLDSALERQNSIDVSIGDLGDSAVIRTSNEVALSNALTSLIAAVVREAPGTRFTLTARSASAPGATTDKSTGTPVSGDASTREVSRATIDVALGVPHLVSELLAGPSTPGAGSVPLERGGLGLSLVLAALVLESHGIVTWTINDQRAALGIRFLAEVG